MIDNFKPEPAAPIGLARELTFERNILSLIRPDAFDDQLSAGYRRVPDRQFRFRRSSQSKRDDAAQ
jgi:hypothetical protein